MEVYLHSAHSQEERFQLFFISYTAPGAQLWFLSLFWADLLVGRPICTLPGQRGGSLQPLTEFLVVRGFCTLPAQWGRSWHPLMDFLVAEAIHALPGQCRQVLGLAGRIPSG